MISTSMRARVLERDDYRCWLCGRGVSTSRKGGVRATVDHVLPAWRGRDDSPGNLAACCKQCNEARAGVQVADGGAPRQALYLALVECRRREVHDKAAAAVVAAREWAFALRSADEAAHADYATEAMYPLNRFERDADDMAPALVRRLGKCALDVVGDLQARFETYHIGACRFAVMRAVFEARTLPLPAPAGRSMRAPATEASLDRAATKTPSRGDAAPKFVEAKIDNGPLRPRHLAPARAPWTQLFPHERGERLRRAEFVIARCMLEAGLEAAWTDFWKTKKDDAARLVEMLAAGTTREDAVVGEVFAWARDTGFQPRPASKPHRGIRDRIDTEAQPGREANNGEKTA